MPEIGGRFSGVSQGSFAPAVTASCGSEVEELACRTSNLSTALCMTGLSAPSVFYRPMSYGTAAAGR
jgi:hypothetical protein